MNPSYFVIFCILCLDMKRLWEKSRRRKCFAFVFGILFSCSMVFGYYIQTKHYVFAGEESILEILLLITFVSIPSSCLFDILCDFFEKCRGEIKSQGMSVKRFAVLAFGTIFVAWFPVWLAFYPGVYGYDAMLQTHYCIHLGYWTNQQPLLHTLLLGAFWNIGKLLGGTIETGMAIYTFVQMLVLDAAFTYALTFLYERKIKGIRWMVLWFALFPVHPMLAVAITKDTLFTAFALVFVVYQFKYMDKNPSRSSLIGITVLTVLMLLFRNNAIHAFVVGGIVSFFIIKKKKRRTYAVVMLVCIGIFGGAKTVMMTQTGAVSSPIAESLAVPLQQMARVGRDADLEAVSAYISPEAASAYNEIIVDPVKWTIKDGKIDDLGAFAKTWLTVGRKYFKIYLDAFIANTAGYWYVDDSMVARLKYIQTQNINPKDGSCDVETHTKCNLVYEKMCEWFGTSNEYQNNIILVFFCSIAIYTWLLVFYIFYMVYRKKWKFLVPVMFLAAYLMTLFLGPCVLARYAYVLMVTAPVLLGILMEQGKGKGKNGQDCNIDTVLQ